jgi:uncharacterized protein YpmB
MKMILKKWPYLISILVIIVFFIVVAVDFYNTCNEPTSSTGPGKGQGRIPLQNYTLWIASALILAVIISVSYYLISKSMKKQLEENMKLISQIVNIDSNNDQSEIKNVENSCKAVLLKFLNYNENKVLKKLIEHNGNVLQSEISRLPNMGKVKAHRVLKDMEIKGIISIDKYGKTNHITLSEDVKKLFLE